MGLNSDACLWTACPPQAWPDVPAQMTVTTLAAIETCPRQWALRTASYPELWSGRGYPPRAHLATLSGSVVHLALESITKALIGAGCHSLLDPTAFQVLKDLGGITKVLDDSIERSLQHLGSSPRAKHLVEPAGRALRGRLSELRTRVQTALCRRRLPSAPVTTQPRSHTPTSRRPMSLGVFAEVDLIAQEIGWRGRADLLVVTPDCCEITDFKTGAPDEKHAFQLCVYALLWNRDPVANPTKRRADRLVISYSGSDTEAPAPTFDELDSLAEQLIERSNSARQAVSQHPPPAKPCRDSCRNCDVRHMCTAYWTDETLKRMAHTVDHRRDVDIEVIITGRHGPASWDATLEHSALAARGGALLLRTTSPRSLLASGQRVRVLSVSISAPDEDYAGQTEVVGTISSTSEVFLVG